MTQPQLSNFEEKQLYQKKNCLSENTFCIATSRFNVHTFEPRKSSNICNTIIDTKSLYIEKQNRHQIIG